jgi:hypothetical protein
MSSEGFLQRTQPPLSLAGKCRLALYLSCQSVLLNEIDSIMSCLVLVDSSDSSSHRFLLAALLLLRCPQKKGKKAEEWSESEFGEEQLSQSGH